MAGLLLLEEWDAWPGKADEGAGFFWLVVGFATVAGLLLEEWDAWLGDDDGGADFIWVVVVGCALMAGVLLEEWDAWLGEADAGDWLGVVEPEVLATSTRIGAALAAEEEDAELVAGEDGTGLTLPIPLPLAPPTTHPGTRSAGVAGAGPSVTAIQPGRCDNRAPGPPCSSGRGFFAAHEFITESG